MAKMVSHFNPSQNGFLFPNRFKLRLPIKYSLPFVGKLDLNDVIFGLCGGMCAAALDYFYANEKLPDYDNPENIDRKLFTYLCERQLHSLTIPVLLKIIEWMMLDDSELVTRMIRSEIPKLRRSLDKGQPVILCLIRTRGLDNPTGNHQVLVTGYERTTDGKSLILNLYDPNHPCQEPEIRVGLSRTDFHISQSTGEPLRGIFVIPYKRRKSLPRPPAAQPVSFTMTTAGEGFRLAWPVDSRVCTQHFNENPAFYAGFGLPGHEGLDLLALDGARVYACADGEVVEARFRPGGHPYGIHVRIRHMYDGQEYQTIYGHMKSIMVQVGQQVRAGQQIGLADSTGNSTGSHLHLTLKKIGASTGKYPPGIVDPWPYLQDAVTPPDVPPPSPSGITVYTNAQLNLRAGPSTEAVILTTVPAAEALAVLGSAETEREKIGQEGRWLQVQTAAGLVGFVAAWHVTDTRDEPFPPSGLVVYPIGEVNMRSGPGIGFDRLGTFSYTDPLTVLGDADLALADLGRKGAWLQVQSQNGERGFVAAWLVHRTGQPLPATGLTVYPTVAVNLRARPSTDANTLAIAAPGDALAVLGDKDHAAACIGQQGQWLNVKTPTRLIGFVAAWLVKAGDPPPPQPGEDLVVYPNATDGVNLRAQPTTNAPIVATAAYNEPLTLIDSDVDAALSRIGQPEQWVYVLKAGGKRGWVAAWYLSHDPA